MTTVVNNGAETNILSNYVEGSLTYVASRSCSISTTNPPPTSRPTASCSATGLNGSPQNMYYSNACDTSIAGGYKLCSALGALVGATGFVFTLQVALLLLTALAIAASIGLAHRLGRPAPSAASEDGVSLFDPLAAKAAASDAHAQGHWLTWGRRSLDQAGPLLLLQAAIMFLGIIFVITWPSAVNNVLSLLIADLQSQQPTPLPAGYSVSYSLNPGPATGYWIVFGGLLFAALATIAAFRLYRSSAGAVGGAGGLTGASGFESSSSGSSGGGVSHSPLVGSAGSAAGGELIYSALPGPAAGAAAAPVPVAVGPATNPF